MISIIQLIHGLNRVIQSGIKSSCIVWSIEGDVVKGSDYSFVAHGTPMWRKIKGIDMKSRSFCKRFFFFFKSSTIKAYKTVNMTTLVPVYTGIIPKPLSYYCQRGCLFNICSTKVKGVMMDIVKNHYNGIG